MVHYNLKLNESNLYKNKSAAEWKQKHKYVQTSMLFIWAIQILPQDLVPQITAIYEQKDMQTAIFGTPEKNGALLCRLARKRLLSFKIIRIVQSDKMCILNTLCWLSTVPRYGPCI